MDKRENAVNSEIVKPTVIIRAATPEEEREREYNIQLIKSFFIRNMDIQLHYLKM